MPLGESSLKFPELDNHADEKPSAFVGQKSFKFNERVMDWVRRVDTLVGRLMRGLSPDVHFRSVVITEINTAAAATYTSAQLLGRWILRDPSGAPRTDVLPTATLLAAAVPGGTPTRENPQLRVGHSFSFVVRNTGGSTITVSAGTGGTMVGTATVATLNQREFEVVFDDVKTPTYKVYSRGSEVF